MPFFDKYKSVSVGELQRYKRNTTQLDVLLLQNRGVVPVSPLYTSHHPIIDYFPFTSCSVGFYSLYMIYEHVSVPFVDQTPNFL